MNDRIVLMNSDRTICTMPAKVLSARWFESVLRARTVEFDLTEVRLISQSLPAIIRFVFEPIVFLEGTTGRWTISQRSWDDGLWDLEFLIRKELGQKIRGRITMSWDHDEEEFSYDMCR